MDKNTFIDLATSTSLADIISVLRTTKILGLIDQDYLQEALEILEEDSANADLFFFWREESLFVTLLNTPCGDLEAYAKDINNLQAIHLG